MGSDHRYYLARTVDFSHGITLPKITEAIPGTWPVTNRDGQVVLGSMDANGKTLHDLFVSKGATPQQAAAAEQMLQRHIDELNQETLRIRASTRVTSEPQLIMREQKVAMRNGEYRSFDDVVGWHVLKTRLEASGAQITNLTPLSEGPAVWTRDRHVVGPDGKAVFLVIDEKDDFDRKSNKIGAIAASEFAQLNRPIQVALTRMEGGDILQHPKSNTVFIGVNSDEKGAFFPDELKSAQAIAASLHMKLVPVPKKTKEDGLYMTNGYQAYYHLDTFMTILPDGSMVLIPDATTLKGRNDILKAMKGHGKVLELPIKPGESAAEAVQRRDLATNMVTINGNSFTANVLPEVKQFLEKHGFQALEIPARLINSGPHCQTNFLYRGKPDGRSDISALAPENLPRFAVADIPESPAQFDAGAATALPHSKDNQLG